MRRRQYLATAGTVGLAVLAGTPDTGSPSDRLAGPETIQQADSSTADWLPVEQSKLIRAAPKDGIPAIVDPEFGDSWAALPDDGPHGGRTLRHDDVILGVTAGDRARAYPLKVLSRHEVVNDVFGDPIAVTYCPVCRSGLVANRDVAGKTRRFGVSGLLYQANLVLYDEPSDTLWSQIAARAIRGPLTGTGLSLFAATKTTWTDWQASHPETDVLLPPPRSGTVVGPVSLNYELDIYERWREFAKHDPTVGPLGQLEWDDVRLERRALVLGIAHDGEARAYPKTELQQASPIHDAVGGLPVVVTASDADRLFAYDRRVDGNRLTFTDDGDALRAGGSRWDRVSGRALDGPHEGTTLSPAPSQGPLFWAAWLQFYPDTTVFRHD